MFGVVDKSYSLEHLMGNCQDFEEEETLLQSMGREMGVMVDRTPKCHCELAGEGVEYSWGCAKNTYRHVPLKKKRGKENFRNVVCECMSKENVSTTEPFLDGQERIFALTTARSGARKRNNKPLENQTQQQQPTMAH